MRLEAIWQQSKLYDQLAIESLACKFLDTYALIVRQRRRELARESGPYIAAIKDRHIPCIEERLAFLKRLQDAFWVLANQDHRASDHQFEELGRMVDQLMKDYEARLIQPLRAAVRRGNKGAREVLKKTIKTCDALTDKAISKLENRLALFERVLCRAAIVESKSSTPVTVTVASIDLSQYGRHTDDIESYFKAEGTFLLNDKINKMIRDALRAVGISSEDVLLIESGDGALVIFRHAAEHEIGPQTAFRFAREFYSITEEHNSEVSKLDRRLYFRVGLATGEVVLHKTAIRSHGAINVRVGGTAVSRAVRLESAARTGEVLICQQTYKLIPTDTSKFGEEEKILGKAHENFPIPAFRCQVIPPEPNDL